ncbi:MAG: hypothetical protein KGL25_04415 [Gammaproteobacteria bacterium]|nr:hypothetical protein [Gammaproteobacteria bacterium]MDE2250628.1 hypothetical protein [Gammaproteobacteria bacterium]
MRLIQANALARAAGVACLLALAATAGIAYSAESEHMDHPAPSKEMRAKMAAAHEQLAACLKSDKPISECHEEMMKMHEEHMMQMEAGEHGEKDMHDCMRHMHHDHDKAGAAQPPAGAKPK